MTAVMVEMSPTRTEEGDDELSFFDDAETFGAAAQPGCGDDNPYV